MPTIDTDSCAFCLNHYSPDPNQNICSKTSCGHIFHTECLDPWLSVSPSIDCPLCRSRVTVIDSKVLISRGLEQGKKTTIWTTVGIGISILGGSIGVALGILTEKILDALNLRPACWGKNAEEYQKSVQVLIDKQSFKPLDLTKPKDLAIAIAGLTIIILAIAALRSLIHVVAAYSRDKKHAVTKIFYRPPQPKVSPGEQV